MKTLSLEQMEVVEGGKWYQTFLPNNPCELALGMGSSAWTAAITVVNPLAGAIFAVGSSYLAGKACKNAKGNWFY